MISDIFSKTKLKNVKDIYKYTDDYIEFLVLRSFTNVNMVNIRKIEEMIISKYTNSLVKRNSIEKVCEDYFYTKYENVIFTKRQTEHSKEIQNMKEELKKLIILDIDELYRLLNQSFFYMPNNLEDTIKYYMTLYLKETVWREDDLLYFYYNLSKNYFEMYRALNYYIDNIQLGYNNTLVDEVVFNDVQKKIFFLNNIEFVTDLKKLPIRSLLIIYFQYFDEFIEKIEPYTLTLKELENKIKYEIKEKFGEIEKTVLIKRYDINNSKTLNELGIEYGLTRERIRQYEERGIRKISTISILKNFLELLISEKEDKDYYSIDEFLCNIKDEDIKLFILIYLYKASNDFIYDKNVGIIYNKNTHSIDKILNYYEERLEDFIKKEKLNKFNLVEKYILNEKYNLYKNVVYIKKGLSITDIYMEIIKKIYPNGYHIGSDENYEKFVKFFHDEFGIIEVSSKHSIQAIIERKGFILKDKGIYISKEYAAIIPEELIMKIIDDIECTYIENNVSIIYYLTLFEKYQSQLSKYGVDNRFYLKGLLDEKLPKDFITKRDYIMIAETDVTPKEYLVSTFKEFGEYFTLDDIKDKVPGLKDYTYNAYIDKEIANGLIKSDSHTYIYIKDKRISEVTINKLRKLIEEMFNLLECNILSVRKIYARLKITHKDLIEELHLQGGHFELFSIIQFYFKDEYCFSRPLISKESEFLTTTGRIVKDYVMKLDEFEHSKIQSYIDRMNLYGLTSYLNFMEDLSEEFVQVSIDKMVRKEKFNIGELELKQIKNLVGLIIDSFGELNTKEFRAFSMLPKLSFEWNQYLLAGVIRTFLYEEFQVENTENMYTKTDFIIRRI